MNLVLPELSDGDLPQVDGPKLGPFHHNGGNIIFLRLLGAGKHGYVFEVIIESQRYALKVFKFYNPLFHQDLTLFNIPSDAITLHVDPFFAECRAFGRLKDCGLDGDVAVHCYGYIKLPLEFENIARRFEAFFWDRPPQDGTSEPQLFRGIIKELVPPDVPYFTSEMAEKMRADLSTLHKIGVFPRDVRKDNYRGGRLTDFSVSWTWPHVMLTFRGSVEMALRKQDKFFHEMVQEMPSLTTVLGSEKGG